MLIYQGRAQKQNHILHIQALHCIPYIHRWMDGSIRYRMSNHFVIARYAFFLLAPLHYCVSIYVALQYAWSEMYSNTVMLFRLYTHIFGEDLRRYSWFISSVPSMCPYEVHLSILWVTLYRLPTIEQRNWHNTIQIKQMIEYTLDLYEHMKHIYVYSVMMNFDIFKSRIMLPLIQLYRIPAIIFLTTYTCL